MPRRFVVLQTSNDEFLTWQQELLRVEHQKRRQIRVDNGEDEEEEAGDEDEAEDGPEAIPDAEEEDFEEKQRELFNGGASAGDVLQTMEAYVALPKLEEPCDLAKLPALLKSDPAAPVPEEINPQDFADGANSAVGILHEQFKVPQLTVHADGRTPEALCELLDAATGGFPGPRLELPKPIEGAEEAENYKALLTAGFDPPFEENPNRVSRCWSAWRLQCPVSLYDKKLRKGEQRLAVAYAGRVFLFADEECQRRFRRWPRRFLTASPRINAEGMNLGFVLLSPFGCGLSALAQKLTDIYGFDIVDLAAVIEGALQAPFDVAEPAEGEEPESEREQRERLELGDGIPRLEEAEQKLLVSGKPLGVETLVRLIAVRLGVQKNLALIEDQKQRTKEAKELLENDVPDGEEPPDIPKDDDGEPIIELAEPLHRPVRGFVLVNFPDTLELFTALKDMLRLEIGKALILKPQPEGEEDEAPDLKGLLVKKGLEGEVPLDPDIVGAFETNVEALKAESGQEESFFAEVALQAEEHEQLVAVRKIIDPFYKVVEEDADVRMDIPNPDEWVKPDPVEPDDEDAPPPEEEQRPEIPWGVCGHYCPVTLKEDLWLCPGSKAEENQHVFGSRVFACASATQSRALLAEPTRYIPESEPRLPPGRVLITGPTGAGVAEQCEKLAKAYGIWPRGVVNLEQEWSKEVQRRLDAVKAKRKQEAEVAKLQESMLNDEGLPIWPPGWEPPPEKSEDDEGEEEQAEAQAEEEDGLEDEQREALYVEAMRAVLGSHCGACVINGCFWSDLGNEALSEEMKAARYLENLLVKARRLPDLVLVMRCKADLAVKNHLNFEKIDKDWLERVVEFQKSVLNVGEEEDPPAAPEDLNIPEALAEATLQQLEEVLNEPDKFLAGVPEEDRESTREKEKFIERFTEEQERLKAFIGVEEGGIREARGALERVPTDRGVEPTHKAIRWHCRPYMEQRVNLLASRQTIKVRASKCSDLSKNGLILPSRFAFASPMFVDAPLFAGRPDARHYAVGFRERLYYPRNAAEQDQFRARPLDFMSHPNPSKILVHPAVVVCGPPLCGKSTLARQLADRTGAVHITIPEVISGLLSLGASTPIHKLTLDTEEDWNEVRLRPFMAQILAAATVSDTYVLDKEGTKNKTASKTERESPWLLPVAELGEFPVTLTVVVRCQATMPCPLSKEIAGALKRGESVRDEHIIAALRQRMRSADVLQRGWVLEDFPLTVAQAKALTAAGIVPHRLLSLRVPESTLMQRARYLAEISLEALPVDLDLLQREVTLQRHRIDAHAKNSPLMLSYYSLAFDNVRQIDGTRSPWAVDDVALEETAAAVSQRLEYYRRTAEDLPARIHGMCFDAQRLAKLESSWRYYCPVTLTLGNELKLCKDMRYVVEYKGKAHWMASEEYAQLFFDDPESFIRIPLPESTPQFLSFVERHGGPSCEIDGYCPVALVDRRELVKPGHSFVCQFASKYWTFESKAACEKFMRRPLRYTGSAKLPAKKPPLKGQQTVSLLSALSKDKELNPQDMLTFMQASVAESVSQALVESGEARPMYPGKSAQESALLFLARYLRAGNALNTERLAAEVRGQLTEFLDDCDLPQQVKELTRRRRAAKEPGARETWTSCDERRYEMATSRFDRLFCAGGS